MFDISSGGKRKLKIFTLLIVDLTIPILIIGMDLVGFFYNLAAIFLLPLYGISVVVNIVVLFVLKRVYSDIPALQLKRGILLKCLVLAVSTGFVLSVPIFTTKIIAPYFDAYLTSEGENSLKKLEQSYKEPTYLPSQLQLLLVKKFVSASSVPIQGYAKIETEYMCQLIGETGEAFNDHGLTVTVSPSSERRSTYNKNLEKVSIFGREAFFLWDDSSLAFSLVLNEGDVVREVYGNRSCGVEKEDLVKIMESLQSAHSIEYRSRTVHTPYHVFYSSGEF